MRFPAKNTTDVPNIVFDVIMPRLTGEEMKDILTIYRKAETQEEAWGILCSRGYANDDDLEGGSK